MSTTHDSNVDSSPSPPRKQSVGQRVFLMFLGFVIVFYGSILAYHTLVPQRSATTEKDADAGLLEQCRQLCLAYGLVPTGHVANDAKAYVRANRTGRPEPLHEILMDKDFVPATTQDHPLLGRIAPDFRLKDDRGEVFQLSQLSAEGPVIVVFYYGYHCSHCVAQLFALNEDLEKFKGMGARIVALSADSPEETAARFAEYGRFEFPVLADLDNAVAEQYGVYRPAIADKPAELLHGTFVVDQTGRIVWTYKGTQPFMDSKSLLFLLGQDHDEPQAASTAL